MLCSSFILCGDFGLNQPRDLFLILKRTFNRIFLICEFVLSYCYFLIIVSYAEVTFQATLRSEWFRYDWVEEIEILWYFWLQSTLWLFLSLKVNWLVSFIFCIIFHFIFWFIYWRLPLINWQLIQIPSSPHFV